MARLPDPVETGLSPEQKALYDELCSNRGRIDGMYRSLLNHPDLLARVSALGTFFRFGESVLPDAVREFVILATSASLKAGYEWVKHVPPARKAGLADSVMESLRQGQVPEGLSPELTAVYEAVKRVQRFESLPKDLQETLERAYGVKGVLEIVSLCGFYRMIAGVIFAFDVPLPEGERDPF